LALTTTREPSSLWRSWRGRLYEQHGGPAENPAFWEAISPNTYLGDLSGPIQLHHGTADEIVPVAYSENLYEAMEEAGRLASLYLYEGDDHNFSQSFVPAITASIQFFDRYVKAPRP
jgi:dipeptidyl aminopeptidase/acylaminoacyl peptidase